MFENLKAWRDRKREERREALNFERKVVVTLSEDGISASYPDGAILAISWDEVERVAIETNDSGPWGADFWWLLEGDGKGCAFPQGATGESEAMAAFPSHFPDFDYKAVIEANTCTSNARFLCWERVGEA